ncbi:unnamed protein product [Oncorhynchus mykiss]|uniref:Uncharacterized protein n=1 Tax=Oncorhynchus mykiss TaxID=8022 RepID=A0A060Y948_ONCMY|nr:unnamed protein product [Oncorhynchus mykiss]
MVPSKLTALELNSSICNWVLDFLTGHPQLVKVVNITFPTLILNTGPHKDTSSVPSCTPCIPTTALPHTVPTPLSSTNNNKMAYREEVGTLMAWCQVNNLSLKVSKTKEPIVDFRGDQAGPHPRQRGRRGDGKKYQVPWYSEELKWSKHTDIVVKKAEQQLFNLRRLNK